MTPDDHYEAWKQQHKAVPAGFAERVMSNVRRRQRQRAGLVVLRAWLAALLSSRAARFGLCSLAVLFGLFRVLQVLAVFLAPTFGL